MASMVIFRDLVRIEYLKPYFDLAAVPVNAQWGMFILFVVSLVIGVGLLAVLMIQVIPRIAANARERLDNASVS